MIFWPVLNVNERGGEDDVDGLSKGAEEASPGLLGRPTTNFLDVVELSLEINGSFQGKLTNEEIHNLLQTWELKWIPQGIDEASVLQQGEKEGEKMIHNGSGEAGGETAVAHESTLEVHEPSVAFGMLVTKQASF